MRDRLLRLMKSDVLHVNDWKYMCDLSKKIEESYLVSVILILFCE